MRFIWQDVPRSVRKVVEPHVKMFAPMIPTWFESVTIAFGHSDDPNEIAGVVRAHEYRIARMTIHPGFLTLDEHRQALSILHEFVHLPISPVREVFDNLMESCVAEEDPLTNWGYEEWRKAEESAVTDLEYGIARLMGLTPESR